MPYICGMISRLIKRNIDQRFKDRKAIILIGPRQVGKSTLLEDYFSHEKVMVLNGDDADTRELFKDANVSKLKRWIGTNELLIIDEAQRIENIGLGLKIIIDQIKQVKIIASGSSAFDLGNKLNESLTGRKWEFQMFPFSFEELVEHHGYIEEFRSLEQRLIYGSYPDVINHPQDAKAIIKSIADSYLYKDILVLDRINKPEKLEKLLQGLAFQVGSEVSYNELARFTGIDKETVEKYIQLLEKAFVLFRLPSYSRNLRNELKKSRKIYFYDNGIRNAIINQFSPLHSRNDVGALWENYIIGERMKFNHYHGHLCNAYFWRTTAQQEVDYIEVFDGEFNAYEFKWNDLKKARFAKTFVDAYQPKEMKVVTPKNYEEFLMK